MKTVIMKIIKNLLITIISIIFIYMVFTIGYFISWCHENQLKLFTDDIASEISYLDKDKVEELGDYVGDYADLLEYSLQERNLKEEEAYIIAEHFDSLGFSVWSYLREEVLKIINKYDTLSVCLGISIPIVYNISTSKKINKILKFVIGYVGPMLIIPPIYTYICRFRLLNIWEIYSIGIPKIFYTVYTVIFILMFIINYIVAKKMVKELNRTIIKKGGCYYE